MQYQQVSVWRALGWQRVGVSLLLAACSDASTTHEDRTDAGRQQDAGEQLDASDEEPRAGRDGGSEQADGSLDASDEEPRAGRDGGSEQADGSLDAGGEETGADADSGPDTDASLEMDAGLELDSGTDAGPDVDAGLPDAAEPAASFIANGGFEQWTQALPQGWFGPASNIDVSNVAKVTTGAYAGTNALRLTNTGSTHKRFTSQAISLPAGSYVCTYQFRGTGEIRNAYLAQDYSSYSGYVDASRTEWRTVSYEFALAQDAVDSFELIFSLRNTAEDQLLIDDVICGPKTAP